MELLILGPDGREPSYSEAHVEMQDDCFIETDCLDSHALTDPGKEGSCLSISDVLMSNIFRSAFSHLKIISPKTFMKCVSKNRQNDNGYANDKFWCRNPTAKLACESNVELWECKTGSYTCDIPVDPFWPLCMYELRGKCNNDECPWQHVRDNKVISRDQHGDIDAVGMESRANFIYKKHSVCLDMNTIYTVLFLFVSVLCAFYHY